jgi:RNA polymerase sigma-70 factor (ECF subfamily)
MHVLRAESSRRRVFAEALASRNRFRGYTEDDAVGWLYGIARHLLLRYFKRGRAERKVLDRLRIEPPALTDEELERIVELAELVPLRAAIAEKLTQLPARQQDALRLRVVDELPYSIVAKRLSVSEQTARARVSRGLRALASALAQCGALSREMIT